jgi:predicted nucleic acid-binding protein
VVARLYAADVGHPLGQRVAALFPDLPLAKAEVFGVGSVLLIPEVTMKPARQGDAQVVGHLWQLLGRLDLRPVTRETAKVATALGAKYGLSMAESVHLATAIEVGADRFITNNQRDFSRTISEIAVTYPEDLAEPHQGE